MIPFPCLWSQLILTFPWVPLLFLPQATQDDPLPNYAILGSTAQVPSDNPFLMEVLRGLESLQRGD